jgi:hypothetical protein
MSKKNRGNRPPIQGLTPKGTGKLVKMPVSPPPGPAQPVKQEITELDWLRWRVAQQKEQGLLARKSKLETEQKAIQLEQDNLNLRIQLLQHENKRDIGHMNLGPRDRVVAEENRYWIIRSPDSPGLKTPPILSMPKALPGPVGGEAKPEDESPQGAAEEPPEQPVGPDPQEPEGEEEGEDEEVDGDDGEDGDAEKQEGGEAEANVVPK